MKHHPSFAINDPSFAINNPSFAIKGLAPARARAREDTRARARPLARVARLVPSDL